MSSPIIPRTIRTQTQTETTHSSFVNKKKQQPFFPPRVIQPKLTIAPANDPYEREADAMADKVMRKCAACEEEEKDIHRTASPSNSAPAATPGSVPAATPSVHEALQSPGQSMDAGTRSFMESRFGYDFSDVRIHNDPLAHQSSTEINALAYTHGRDIVFGADQYQPGSEGGKRLLAHELTHVIQQKNDGEAYQAKLFRRVGTVNCPANVAGAPDDPRAALEGIQPNAQALAAQAADSLKADSDAVKAGIPDDPSVTFQAYRDHFGLPVASGTGFLNRLTGVVRPSLEIAASEELNILSKRFQLSSRFFSQTVNYRCPGDAPLTLVGCSAVACDGDFAFSCLGNSTIALCAPFWQTLATDDARAVGLIHESLHIIFGDIVEGTQRGPGRNFNVAGCYEFIVDALNGAESFPVCPDVP